MQSKPINVNGILYPAIIDACDTFNITYNAFRGRLRKGLTVEEAFGCSPWPERLEPSCYTLYEIVNLVNGKTYVGLTIQSLQQRYAQHTSFAKSKKADKHPLYRAMIKYGIEYFEIRTIRNDAKNGLELQQQEIEEIDRRSSLKHGYNLHPGGQAGRKKSIMIGQILFDSCAEAAFYYGVQGGTFAFRVRSGWTPEQAAELEPPPNVKRHKIVIGDNQMSMRQAASMIGINYKTVHLRVKKGMSYEQALDIETLPSQRYQRKIIEIDGIKYKSLRAASNAFGIDYGAVNTRIKNGWTFREALGLDERLHRGRQKGTEVIVHGQTYPSISACARAFGIDMKALWRRINQLGEDVEIAISRLMKGALSYSEV